MFTKKQATNRLFVFLLMLWLISGLSLRVAAEQKDPNAKTSSSETLHKEDTSHQQIRSYAPAQHKMGLSGRLFLSDGWVLNSNYRYTGTTPVIGDTMIYDVGASHRIDLTIAKEFAKGRGEVMIGVSDIFNRTNGPNYAIGGLTAHETPGQTFFARVQLKF